MAIRDIISCSGIGGATPREERMRQQSAAWVAVILAVTLGNTGHASQIQAFKNSPARPATAAHEIAREQSEGVHTPDTPEGRAEKALNDAHFNRGALYALLREMPKGGDLHNHITGAVYAESLLGFAAESGLCLDRQTLVLSEPAAGAGCKEGQARRARHRPTRSFTATQLMRGPCVGCDPEWTATTIFLTASRNSRPPLMRTWARYWLR
jgi:hypothetical protein